MTTWGANADQLDALAAAFGRAADLLDQNRVRLNSQVHHTPWRGHEADRFRRDWDSRWVPHLGSASAFLHQARTRLQSNAAAQRGASTPTSALVGHGAGIRVGRVSYTSLTQIVATMMAIAPIVKKSWADGKAVVAAGQYVLKLDRVLSKYHTSPQQLKALGIKNTWKVSGMSAVTAGVDAAKVGSRLANHEYAAALFGTKDVIIDVATINPVGREMYLAWQTGTAVGTVIGDRILVPYAVPHVTSDAVRALYGTTEDHLTPSQAAQYAHRYDGISGFAHFGSDFAHTATSGAKSFLKKLF